MPTLEDFEPHVGTTFAVGDVLELTLTEAESTPHGFALVFTGPDEPRLSQGTAELTHPVLGELTIFIVPIGPARYEAIFS